MRWIQLCGFAQRLLGVSVPFQEEQLQSQSSVGTGIGDLLHQLLPRVQASGGTRVRDGDHEETLRFRKRLRLRFRALQLRKSRRDSRRHAVQRAGLNEVGIELQRFREFARGFGVADVLEELLALLEMFQRLGDFVVMGISAGFTGWVVDDAGGELVD
jgi:hypothetical protein